MSQKSSSDTTEKQRDKVKCYVVLKRSPRILKGRIQSTYSTRVSEVKEYETARPVLDVATELPNL